MALIRRFPSIGVALKVGKISFCHRYGLHFISNGKIDRAAVGRLVESA